MKYTFAILLLFTISCSRNDSSEAVKKEILDLTAHYNKTWETLNAEQIASYHSNESFQYWWHGELQCASNDQFRNAFSKILPMMRKWTVKKISQFSVQATKPIRRSQVHVARSCTAPGAGCIPALSIGCPGLP